MSGAELERRGRDQRWTDESIHANPFAIYDSRDSVVLLRAHDYTAGRKRNKSRIIIVSLILATRARSIGGSARCISRYTISRGAAVD